MNELSMMRLWRPQMHKKVSRSGAHQTISDLVAHRTDVQESLRLFFSRSNPTPPIRLIGSTPAELGNALIYAANEADLQAILTMLAAVEAAFRIDYVTRCEGKLKDRLSRAFRKIYRKKGSAVRFEEDILDVWKSEVEGSNVGVIKTAMKHRHWLAHGRYWEPKFGRNYDFTSIALLATGIFNSFDFEGI